MTIRIRHSAVRNRRPIRPGAGNARASFTLIELLIVITIISVLLLLTIRVVGAVYDSARQSATEATIRKVQGMLGARAEALHRLTTRRKRQLAPFLQRSTQYNDATVTVHLKTGDTTLPRVTDEQLREVLAIKAMMRDYFPQMPSEVTLKLQPAIYNKLGLTNSAILYDFLVQSSAIGEPPLAADAFSTSELRDNANGDPELIDAWGQPLRFYRWPTRLFRSGGNDSGLQPITVADLANVKVLFSTLPSFSGSTNLATDLARDPDDPLTKCASKIATGFLEHPCTGLSFTPTTYHAMLVVSSGPDRKLGLYEPDVVDANNGHLGAIRDVNALYDDITYLNVRAGGR